MRTTLLAICMLVSVPSRGIRYLNEYDIERSKQGYVGFRPLSGNKVSELYILCHPRHDILYIFFKGFLVSDTPLISTPYHTINT